MIGNPSLPLLAAQPPVVMKSLHNGGGPNSTSANGMSATAGSSPVGKHMSTSLETKNLESDLTARSVALLL